MSVSDQIVAGKVLRFRNISGAGEENLIRDAAMDTDSDGDGVVDGFRSAGGGSETTYSLDGAVDAQKISVDGSQSSTVFPVVRCTVVRIFPGDEVTWSVEVRRQNVSGSPSVLPGLRFRDSDGNQLSGPDTSVSSTSFERATVTATAPAESVLVSPEILLVADTSETVDVWARDARLLRASSDPATYARPRVRTSGLQNGNIIETTGWPENITVFKAGDAFSVGGSGATKSDAETDTVVRPSVSPNKFRAQKTVTSDANGNADIPVDIPNFKQTGSGLNAPAASRAWRIRRRDDL